MRVRLIALSLLLTGLAFVPRCAAGNRIFDELTSRGVAIGPRAVVRLPLPVLPDGLSPDDQKKAVESLAEGRYTWEALTRRSAVAPYVLRLAPSDDPQAIARRIDLCFVVYGDLKTLGSDEFLDRQFKSLGSSSDPERGSSSRRLTNDELVRRGLPVPRNPAEERYTLSEFSLLDRVRVRATTCCIKTETAESVVSASVLESRCKRDKALPVSWQPIIRDETGRRVLGSAQAYSGYGAYAKATRLKEPAGAIFVEYHLVFAEPKGWFGGSNLLGSKLPILAQSIVRQFRRALEKSE